MYPAKAITGKYKYGVVMLYTQTSIYNSFGIDHYVWVVVCLAYIGYYTTRIGKVLVPRWTCYALLAKKVYTFPGSASQSKPGHKLQNNYHHIRYVRVAPGITLTYVYVLLYTYNAVEDLVVTTRVSNNRIRSVRNCIIQRVIVRGSGM